MTKPEEAHPVPGDNGELRDDQLDSVAGGFGSPAEQAALAAARTSATPTWNAGWDAYTRQQGAGVPPSAQPKV